jgi:hypothetical protein
MSKEHLVKQCVDLQAFLTDKQRGKADIDGLQMVGQMDALPVLVKKCLIIRSTAVNKYDFTPNIVEAM